MAKNKVGKPPKYKTPEELEAKINEYFEKGVNVRPVLVGSKDKKEIKNLPVPTITGIAIFLGFESRQSFYDLEKKPDYAYAIKRARLFIEQEYEELLQYGNTTGAIFALKNMGWRDLHEINDMSKDKDMPTAKIVFK